MNTIDESLLTKMKVEEIFKLRRQFAEKGDIVSLLTIAKHRFVRGSAATNEDNFPEICYYFGRLQRLKEFEEFLSDKSFYIARLSKSSLTLAQTLLPIGVKFPYLEEHEIDFLEEKYCDSRTFELFDIIMFDADRLPRPIKRFDKDSLKRSNESFSDDLLMETYTSFSSNTKLNRHDLMRVYSRMDNKIISKKYDDLGLGEYCIMYPIFSNELSELLSRKYGEQCATDFAVNLNYEATDTSIPDLFEIEKFAGQYFNDPIKSEDLKASIALHWLKKVNSKEVKIF